MMGTVSRRLVLSAVLAGCGTKATTPPLAEPMPLPASDAEEARPSVEARPAQPTPPAPPSSRVVLGDMPTHRELAWIIDVLGRRQGVINAVELEQHWDSSSMRGPVAVQSHIEGFRQWGAGATSATVDKIEVDDPTYLRAHVTVGDKRWRIILSLEPSSMKLEYLRWEPLRDAGTGKAP